MQGCMVAERVTLTLRDTSIYTSESDDLYIDDYMYN